MRRRGLLLLALTTMPLALTGPGFAASVAPAQGAERARLAVLVVPDPAVVATESAGWGWGIGVFPDSRDALAFWDAAAAGAPTETAGRSSPLEGHPCAFGEVLEDAGIRVYVTALDDAAAGVAALRRLFCDELRDYDLEAARGFEVLAVAAPDGASAAAALRDWREASLLGDDATIVVAGAGPRTPVTLAVSNARRGLLNGGMARRPGIATAYDLTATLLSRLGVPKPGSGFIGRVLEVRPSAGAAEEVDRLARRLERDAGYGPAVAGATIGVLLGGGVVLPGVLLLMAMAGAGWASSAAVRAARGAAAAVGGYVASLFAPTGNAGVRAIPIVVAFVAAFAWPGVEAVRERRRIGRILLVVSAGIAVLTILAAIRPGAEPALSLYGNPLESWRLFGLRNHLTSMLGLGVLAGAAIAFARPAQPVIAAVGVAGVFVVGAAFLGANFVAVLTLTLGAVLVTWISARKHVEPAAVLVSGALSIAAFGVALLADAGSPATHGGQAVRRVRSAGLEAAWDFLRIRWDLNLESIGSIWGGWVWAAGLAAGLLVLMAWAVRDEHLDSGSRGVLFGAAGAALAALLVEDTGFLTGGILALAPALVAVTVLAERLRLLRYSPESGGEAGMRSRLRRSARR